MIIKVALSSLRTQYFMIALKNIEIRYHHLKDCVQKRIVKLPYIPTKEQVADILTKALARGIFVYFRDKLGVVQNTFLSFFQYLSF